MKGAKCYIWSSPGWKVLDLNTAVLLYCLKQQEKQNGYLASKWNDNEDNTRFHLWTLISKEYVTTVRKLGTRRTIVLKQGTAVITMSWTKNKKQLKGTFSACGIERHKESKCWTKCKNWSKEQVGYLQNLKAKKTSDVTIKMLLTSIQYKNQ